MAIVADAYMSTLLGVTGTSLPAPSLVPARLGAQALGAPQARLVLEAALARRARGFGGLTRFRGRECAADQVAEQLLRLAAVVLLGAVVARDDEDRALGGEAPPAQGPEARLDGLRERRAAREIEAQLHRGGDLVDVLAARAARAHERQRQLAVRNLDASGDLQ